MARLTLKEINARLAMEFGDHIELVRGRGYFYFVGPRVEGAHTTSVMCYRLNDLSIHSWIGEAWRVAEEADSNRYTEN